MVKLREYVDFITSLVEMDEVKNGKFVLPKSINFDLEIMNHKLLHREVLETKEQEVIENLLEESFEIDILGITLKFEQ
tara:strand:- start:677 stop:910 length:234 start_codon:yes stop_codon:yes gene_type:complete